MAYKLVISFLLHIEKKQEGTILLAAFLIIINVTDCLWQIIYLLNIGASDCINTDLKNMRLCILSCLLFEVDLFIILLKINFRKVKNRVGPSLS